MFEDRRALTRVFVSEFILPYLPPDTADYVRNHKVVVLFFSYDWNLNGNVACTNCKSPGCPAPALPMS
jgi:hypothetical protein